MNKSTNCENTWSSIENETEESTSSKGNKCKNKGKKRKRKDSLDEDDALPENTLEVEKNLHAAALKNNLDDESVKKILKKVVTNDHVLALVKIREEEEAGNVKEKMVQPKLTRAKMKELMKASPKSAPWNLELTPIKEIPIKTRPEVKALIAQELPEDEDDEEYKPTNDDVPSDDDQTLESCSDVDSQPRTPATPRASPSPRVLRDGPFKVPQIITPARKKLLLEEEEATIALRTRSKLSLSETPIEHIESSFIPPDDIPTPVIDDRLWSEFLTHVLDPDPAAAATHNEEDDEADPEYNVAADPDANDEDEEGLDGSILKISRKELNDLVTELFNVMPEAADDALVEDLTNNMLSEHVDMTKTGTHWDGKQEPLSDEENLNDNQLTTNRMNTRNSAIRFSLGKSEPEDPEYEDEGQLQIETEQERPIQVVNLPVLRVVCQSQKPVVMMSVEEQNLSVHPAMKPEEDGPPRILRELNPDTNRVDICIDQPVKILPVQLQILQQQLRMHVQLAVSNFLQLFVNPTHWNLAPTYKKYLEQLNKITEENPDSVVNVCNLKPGLELVQTWEQTVSKDTPENRAMVEFIKKEEEKGRRKFQSHNRYIGEFPPQFCSVLANSSVFLYPYLLPAMPYRADKMRKFCYTRTEDGLIALGMDQFWRYVEANPDIYPRPSRVHPRHRWGLSLTCALVCKHMFPWLAPRYLLSHIQKVRKAKDGPIYKFFTSRTIEPVKHKLLPFNPNLTLYEQPEHEMPRVWVRYLAKSSKRFRVFLYRNNYAGTEPEGVELNMSEACQTPSKEPLPIEFTKDIICTRANVKPKVPEPPKKPDKFDIIIQNSNEININREILDSDGEIEDTHILGTLVPCNIIETPTADANACNDAEFDHNSIPKETTNEDVAQNDLQLDSDEHCSTEPKASDTPNRYKKIPVLLGNKMQILTIPVNNTQMTDTEATDSSFNNTLEIDETRTQEMNTMTDIRTDNSNASVNNSSTILRFCLTKENLDKSSIHNKKNNESNISILKTSNIERKSDPKFNKDPKISSSTKTVNSVQSPVISTKQSTQNDQTENHCKCCLLLRKILRTRQSLITEYFTPKSERRCECTHRKYPKVSRKMRMFLNNYEAKFKRHYLELHFKVTGKSYKKDEIDDSFDLDDFVTVTSFHLKLTNRLNIMKDINTKKKIRTMFSKFDINKDNPLYLIAKVYKALEVEGVDLFKEFLGFVTAEQADEIGCFRDYYVQHCVERLLKAVETEVKEDSKRLPILKQIQQLFKNRFLNSACEMCESLLDLMRDYPKLAEYTFSLFPHRAVSTESYRQSCNGKKVQPLPPPSAKKNFVQLSNTPSEQNDVKGSSIDSGENVASEIVVPSQLTATSTDECRMEVDNEAQNENPLTICDVQPKSVTSDADQVQSHSRRTSTNSAPDPQEQIPECQETSSQVTIKVVKSESSASETEPDEFESRIDTDFTETHQEIHTYIDEIEIKAEPIDWRRDEDKFILEVLMEYINAQTNKTIQMLHILENKNVFERLCEKLVDKSMDDIKDRVAYLLLLTLRVNSK